MACQTSPYYVPTPEEIRAACAEIQAGWSDEERAKRAGQTREPLVTRVVHNPIRELQTDWSAA